jgi:PKD repeat protein
MSSLAAVAVTLLAAGPAVAQPATPPGLARAERPAFPVINLPLAAGERPAFGERAVELLGDRLPSVAAYYRMSADELAARLRGDRMLKVDRQGRLFYEEELTAPLPSFTFAEPPRVTLATATPNGAQDALLRGTLLPLDQTFLLNSRPGAKRTIYLNFRGATLSGTAWNSSGTTINAPPFDLDGLPFSFNDAELQRIQGIWQRVAEDFAPFDVNVTTEAPPADRLTRSGSADDVYGTTVLITTRTGVYNCSCGGVAYLSVFDDVGDFYKPALVFYDALGRNEKYIAEAISHEAGHNGGLNHDGWSGGGYYEGHGSGATGWAPIMGVGYYKPLVQWSRGEYATANNAQDDFTVWGQNGVPLRADDHGNTSSLATALVGTVSGGLHTASVSGVIERASDVDAFTMAAGAGTATFTLAPAARDPNLDAVLELRDAAGNVLGSANPLEALGATLTVNLPSAGTYTLLVRGTSKGDPLTTGYTAYGSVGQYLLTAQTAAPSGLPPVAVLSANPTRGTVPLTVAFSSAGSSDPDGTLVSQTWRFGNGGEASGAMASTTYTAAGTYTAELTLTDNSGLSTTRSVVITVDPAVVVVPMRVADIAMGVNVAKNGQARATALVFVRDSAGQPVSGVTVSGRWSGLTSSTANVVTDAQGRASFQSGNSRRRGTFTFEVTGAVRSGYAYDATLNAETRDAITW